MTKKIKFETAHDIAKVGDYTIKIIYDDWYDFIEVTDKDGNQLLFESLPPIK